MTQPNRSDIDHALAAKIDHTLLKPEATPDEVQKLCAEALEYGFASVCVNPCHVKLCAALLKGTSVKVCTVIGFPLGATTTEAKVSESLAALDEGATELDMVINIGFLKAGEDAIVKNDIASVVTAARKHGAITKVILETCLLNDAEKKRGCLLAKEAGADFVKTSTGFSKGGATAADIILMRGIVGPSMGVKASGGVRTRQDAVAMIAAGATRIGASAGIAIVTEQQ